MANSEANRIRKSLLCQSFDSLSDVSLIRTAMVSPVNSIAACNWSKLAEGNKKKEYTHKLRCQYFDSRDKLESRDELRGKKSNKYEILF